MNRTRKAIFAAVFSFLPLSFFAEDFITDGTPVHLAFKYKKGDMYRILSTVDEDVYVNHLINHHSVIVNRVSAAVTDVDTAARRSHN